MYDVLATAKINAFLLICERVDLKNSCHTHIHIEK